jgi:hypothetical protein
MRIYARSASARLSAFVLEDPAEQPRQRLQTPEAGMIQGGNLLHPTVSGLLPSCFDKVMHGCRSMDSPRSCLYKTER